LTQNSAASARSEQRSHSSLAPIAHTIPPKKQAAKRHYGVHPYFTKRAWNVVQEYIKHFSNPGDVVCDPFGGSGVTAIEALVLRRKAIHVDINPLANFLCEQIAMTPVNITNLHNAFEMVAKKCEKRVKELERMSDDEVAEIKPKFWFPQGVRLPSNADVEYVEQLFTRRQLLSLSLIRQAITECADSVSRNLLFLAFSATLNKCNRTFRSTPGRKPSRGDSGIMTVYRYWIPPKPVELPVWEEFSRKFRWVVRAKIETNTEIGDSFRGNCQVIHGSATRLTDLVGNEKIDYIFTDPPYGSHIAYLDLSIMWTSWLGLAVTGEDRRLEVIEGGESEKSKTEYQDLLYASIEEMYKVLKFDRWMSIVFAHKDPAYWDTIRKAAEDIGFEYVNTCVQPSYSPSMHKRKNPLTVLSGELILNFRKVRTPRAIAVAAIGGDAVSLVKNTAELVIARNGSASTEEVYHELIPVLLENGLLGDLREKYEDITPLLKSDFRYSEIDGRWHLDDKRKLGCFVPLKDRIRFYVTDYLRKCDREQHPASFDDIVLHVMPKLVNGETPKRQSILDELRNIAESPDGTHWRLLPDRPQIPFDLKPRSRSSRVSVPVLEMPATEDDATHIGMIYRIAMLGREAGFLVWVGKNEQRDSFNGRSLRELSLETFPLAKSSMTEKQWKRVTQIDVIWFNVTGRPSYAFEVENTPVIVSALDRFRFLLEIEPDVARKLVIVAKRGDLSKVNEELRHSTYIGAPLYMENKVKYVLYPNLLAAYESISRSESPDIIKEISAILLDPTMPE